MRKPVAIAIAAALSCGMFDTASAHGPGGKGTAAFEAYEAGDFPSRYAGVSNPLEPTTGNVAAGRRLYQQNCMMCHGSNAEGEGPMAEHMDIDPADLRTMLRHFPDIDDYYLWIISEGGAEFDVPMPGFADSISEQEIWQIVTWMQSGFEGLDAGTGDGMLHGEGHMMDGDGGTDHMMDGGDAGG